MLSIMIYKKINKKIIVMNNLFKMKKTLIKKIKNYNKNNK